MKLNRRSVLLGVTGLLAAQVDARTKAPRSDLRAILERRIARLEL